MKIQQFPPSVTEQLGYYVYVLSTPEGEPFYVGKGIGNRVFQHAKAALETAHKSDKIDTIRRILANNGDVQHTIVRHGMNEETAFHVESALIDYIGLPELKNKVNGHHGNDIGIMSDADMIAKYSAKPITINEPSLLIIINKEFRKIKNGIQIRPDRMSAEELAAQTKEFARQLYEGTRSSWVLSARRNKAKFVFAVCDGLVREIYRIHSWQPCDGRWEFTGEVACDWECYDVLIGGDVSQYLRAKGAQNPIRYIGC